MKRPFSMRPMIVLDFDDTLISSNLRQYTVIKSFFQRYFIPIVDFEDYIEQRRTHKMSNVQFASQYFSSQVTEDTYKEYFGQNIEADSFLEIDELIVNIELLNYIAQQYDLVLLSLRTSCTQGIKQMESLQIKKYFSDIYFLKHDFPNPKIEILKSLKEKASNIIFVGDTISDYNAAMESKIDFVGVETGLFSLPQQVHTFKNINVFLDKMLNPF